LDQGHDRKIKRNRHKGISLSLQPWLLLIGYTVILGYLSVRLFQWE
jgi:hypothetical protein